MLQGRISKKWRAAYHAFEATRASPETDQLRWGSNLITLLWEYTRSLWKHRNGTVYGHSVEDTKVKRKAKRMDCDGIKCWLGTVKEAKKEEQMFRERLSKMAARFFIPRTSTRRSTGYKVGEVRRNPTGSESGKPVVAQYTEESDNQSQLRDSDITVAEPPDPPEPP